MESRRQYLAYTCRMLLLIESEGSQLHVHSVCVLKALAFAAYLYAAKAKIIRYMHKVFAVHLRENQRRWDAWFAVLDDFCGWHCRPGFDLLDAIAWAYRSCWELTLGEHQWSLMEQRTKTRCLFEWWLCKYHTAQRNGGSRTLPLWIATAGIARLLQNGRLMRLWSVGKRNAGINASDSIHADRCKNKGWNSLKLIWH